MPYCYKSQQAKQVTSVSESCAQSSETQVTFDVGRTLGWWIECCFSCEHISGGI